MFGEGKKRITPREFMEICKGLAPSLNERQEADLEQTFVAALTATDSTDEGISRSEFAAGMEWLKANQTQHSLRDEELAKIQEYFEAYLDD